MTKIQPQIHRQFIPETEDLNGFEENSKKVILVKNENSGTSSNFRPSIGRSPANFPTPPKPPALGRPNWPINTPKVKTAPKVIDQGLGGAANPAGAGNGGGGNAEFEYQCPNPENPKSQEPKIVDYRSNDNQKKKKKSKDQCSLDEKREIVYRIKENPALVREAERMGKDQAAQKDVNNLIEQLRSGNNNTGIGNRRVKSFKNVSEARGRNEGRVYFREMNGKIEILAKSNKDNQNKVINILQKIGY